MSQDINLKSIERKVYLAYHQDGLWDMALGIALAGFGLLMVYDQATFMGVMPVVLFFLTLGAKKIITVPRLGYVKYSPERVSYEKKSKAKLSILLTITMIAGLVCFAAFMGNADWQQWIKGLYLMPFGIVISVVIGSVGILYGLRRFIFYAILILAIFIIGHLLNSDPPAYFILLGIIFFVTGLIMLIRFMIKYPRPANEWIYNDSK